MKAMPSSTEVLQGAYAACTRTLAVRTDVAPLFHTSSPQTWRALADASACHCRFALGSKAQAERPEGAAGKLFDALGDARAEYLGALWLPGIRSNLTMRSEMPVLRDWAYAVFLAGSSKACHPALKSCLEELATHLSVEENFAFAARQLSIALAHDSLEIGASVFMSAEDSSTEHMEASPEGKAQAKDSNQRGTDQAPGVELSPLPGHLSLNYRAFTTRHDRMVKPEDLATPAELFQLRSRLDQDLLPYRLLVDRLAHRLQRQLQARKRNQWNLDQDDGWIDPSRLARLIANPARSEIFRREEKSRHRKAAVTLLLDNSGSMRGHPIAVAAVTADIVAHSLEKCGIKVEVLGYTTADMQGGAPAREWHVAGQPTDPGRLCALRHILYKSMDVPWRRARVGLGLMLKPTLLQENVDGEALAWAAKRLVVRPEPQRLLIVFSDGAPMDKCTLAANPRSYLEQHLIQVVTWIKSKTDLELHAIGFGHPVSRYYPNSVSLCHMDELGTTLIDKLATWLA